MRPPAAAAGSAVAALLCFGAVAAAAAVLTVGCFAVTAGERADTDGVRRWLLLVDAIVDAAGFVAGDFCIGVFHRISTYHTTKQNKTNNNNRNK